MIEKVIRIGGLFDSPNQTHQAGSVYDLQGLAPCLDTATGGYRQPLTIIKGENEMLRIRKLTPKECMRLMGFTDEDYQALVDIGLSDSAIYHCAGDSIITTCLASIIYPLTNDNRQGHKEVVEDYIEHYIIEERKS